MQTSKPITNKCSHIDFKP